MAIWLPEERKMEKYVVNIVCVQIQELHDRMSRLYWDLGRKAVSWKLISIEQVVC